MAETLSSLAALHGADRPARAGAYRRGAGRANLQWRPGPDGPRSDRPLDTLARIAWAEGDRSAAIANALRESRILRSQFDLTASALTEREAMQYEAALRQGLDMSLSVLLSGTWPPSQGRDTAAAWNEVVHSRALVLNELALRNRQIDSSSSPEVRELITNFEKARGELASLQVKGPGPGAPGNTRKCSRRLEPTGKPPSEASQRKAPRIEFSTPSGRSIWMRCWHPCRRLQPWSRTSYSIASPIPPAKDEERNAPMRTTTSYVAFVFVPGQAVQARLLGGSSEIDQLVEAWRSRAGVAPAGLPESQAASERTARTAGERLRQRVWDPLQSSLKGVKQVFIVPDGALHLVNFSALPAGGSLYLLEKGPRFHYLSAERDLASSAGAGDALAHPLIFGGPDFDESSETVLAQQAANGSETPPAGSTRGTVPSPTQRAPAACDQFYRARFESLPGAREEVEVLASLLRQAAGSKRI